MGLHENKHTHASKKNQPKKPHHKTTRKVIFLKLETHYLFAEQVLWHLHLALSATWVLKEIQATSAGINPQLHIYIVHLKGLCPGPNFCLTFTAFPSPGDSSLKAKDEVTA